MEASLDAGCQPSPRRHSTGTETPVRTIMRDEVSLLAEYDAWVTRVAATYEGLLYCCLHRLDDRRLAEQVSLGVVAALIETPTVFRFYGLPYAGRLAHLAEPRIASAKEGTLEPTGVWRELHSDLLGLSQEDQRIVVLTCVEGYDDGQLAMALGCDQETAQRRRDACVTLLQTLARGSLAGPDEDRRR